MTTRTMSRSWKFNWILFQNFTTNFRWWRSLMDAPKMRSSMATSTWFDTARGTLISNISTNFNSGTKYYSCVKIERSGMLPVWSSRFVFAHHVQMQRLSIFSATWRSSRPTCVRCSVEIVWMPYCGSNCVECRLRNLMKNIVADYWYNQKDRRIHQKTRKQYRKRTTSKRSREIFNIDTFTAGLSDSSSGSDNSSESDSGDSASGNDSDDTIEN